MVVEHVNFQMSMFMAITRKLIHKLCIWKYDT